jgi:hypothetical protein
MNSTTFKDTGIIHIFVLMKGGLLYIIFILTVIMTVSFNNARNNQFNDTTQTCQSIASNPDISCIPPEAVASLKKIACVQIVSDVLSRSFSEDRTADGMAITVRASMERCRLVPLTSLVQRVLLFLICNNQGEDDHHLWNK